MTFYSASTQHVVDGLLKYEHKSIREIGLQIHMSTATVRYHIKKLCIMHGISDSQNKDKLIARLKYEVMDLTTLSIDELINLLEQCQIELLCRHDFDFKRVNVEFVTVQENIEAMKG